MAIETVEFETMVQASRDLFDAYIDGWSASGRPHGPAANLRAWAMGRDDYRAMLWDRGRAEDYRLQMFCCVR